MSQSRKAHPLVFRIQPNAITSGDVPLNMFGRAGYNSSRCAVPRIYPVPRVPVQYVLTSKGREARGRDPLRWDAAERVSGAGAGGRVGRLLVSIPHAGALMLAIPIFARADERDAESPHAYRGNPARIARADSKRCIAAGSMHPGNIKNVKKQRRKVLLTLVWRRTTDGAGVAWGIVAGGPCCSIIRIIGAQSDVETLQRQHLSCLAQFPAPFLNVGHYSSNEFQ